MKKEYTITYKFGDIINTLEAENEEEAQKIADELLDKGELQGTSECYDVEVEEVEEK